VRLVDRIAYINHDIDDALRAGIIGVGDLPAGEIGVLGETGSERIDTLVHDLVQHSATAGEIVQGPEVGEAMTRLRQFVFDRVYMGPQARAEHGRIETVLRTLFEHYRAHTKLLPPAVDGASEMGRVVDYIAGMTDRYCVRMFEALSVPRAFA
jgi:dGTPase